MSVGPRCLRQQVVDDVDTSNSQEGQGKLQVRELAGPGVSVYEIELLGRRLFQERRPVHKMKGNSQVVAEVSLRNLQHLGVVVDRIETRTSVHPSQNPCGSNPSAGAKFEKVTIGF